MKRIYKIIVLITLVTGAVSCEDYLDRLPLDTPSDETYFSNETELRMAVTGVYNRLWFWPQGIAWFLSFDFASDDGWDRNGSPLQALGRGEQNADNGYTNSFWPHFYRAIGRVNFIVSNSTHFQLPSEEATKDRITKGAALALKSRVALWNQRWNESASAAQQLINEGVYQVDDNYSSMFTNGGDNSPEVILRIQYLRGVQTHNIAQNFWSRMALGHSNKKPPQDMVDTYGCVDGLSIDESPLYDPQNPFINRDPRLNYTLVVPGSRLVHWTYETNPDSTTTFDFREDPPIRVPNIESSHAFASFTGYLYRKHVDESNYPTDVSSSEQNLTLMRYGEVLLNYVEAKVELNELDQSVYDAINDIRTRPSVNLPPIATGKTQEEMRNIIRKERRHELGMEGFRYFDIRRWRIAEEVMPGPYRGRVNRYSGGGWLAEPPAIDPIGTPSYDHISNADEMVIIETRDFNPERDYLWPIPRIELETNTALTQNPGY